MREVVPAEALLKWVNLHDLLGLINRKRK